MAGLRTHEQNPRNEHPGGGAPSGFTDQVAVYTTVVAISKIFFGVMSAPNEQCSACSHNFIRIETTHISTVYVMLSPDKQSF